MRYTIRWRKGNDDVWMLVGMTNSAMTALYVDEQLKLRGYKVEVEARLF